MADPKQDPTGITNADLPPPTALDLDQLKPEDVSKAKPAAEAGEVEKPSISPAVVELERENVRGSLAKALVLVLAIVVVASFVTLWARVGPVSIADLKDLLAVVLGPVAALVGSATGFYFGGASGSTPKKP